MLLDAEIDTLELKAIPALRSGNVAAFPVRRWPGGSWRSCSKHAIALAIKRIRSSRCAHIYT